MYQYGLRNHLIVSKFPGGACHHTHTQYCVLMIDVMHAETRPALWVTLHNIYIDRFYKGGVVR